MELRPAPYHALSQFLTHRICWLLKQAGVLVTQKGVTGIEGGRDGGWQGVTHLKYLQCNTSVGSRAGQCPLCCLKEFKKQNVTVA